VLIYLKNISKRVDGEEILKDVSLSVDRGEFVSVVGASGSGKSSLLYIMGLLEGVSRAEAEERAAELLRNMGLGGKERRKPYQLSGGEQQRVAVARALANDPAVILADEPTGNLDSRNTEMVMEIFERLNGEGRRDERREADSVIRFRDFMEESVRRYYTSSREKFAGGGDFFTAPELDSLFGEAVAEFLLPYIEKMESPVLLELGAGRGLMARDILSYYRHHRPDLFTRLRYRIYEISPFLKGIQKEVLSEFGCVSWVDDLEAMEGVVLSNEFFDALPVHVVEGNRELYLRGGDASGGPRGEGVPEKNGIRGAEAEDRGSIAVYKKHRLRSDIYSCGGDADMSAQVNFSALITYGRELGLETIFLKKQRDFLTGIPRFLKEIERLAVRRDPLSIERFSRIKIMLISMGDRFRVLFQRKEL